MLYRQKNNLKEWCIYTQEAVLSIQWYSTAECLWGDSEKLDWVFCGSAIGLL